MFKNWQETETKQKNINQSSIKRNSNYALLIGDCHKTNKEQTKSFQL